MEDAVRKELRRQFVHASGIVLVPLAFVFGKTFVGAASLALALIIFILAEHRKNNTNMKSAAKKNANEDAVKSVSHYGMKSASVKQGADKSVPDKSIHIGFQSLMNLHEKPLVFRHAKKRSFLCTIHTVFEKFERSGENYRGAFYFYLASAVSLFLFPLPIATLSITVLALGDSFSTAAGIFGKNKIFYNRKKTWEGTLAGFAAAFAGCLMISPQLAFPAAFIGMFVESLPIKIDDNLTIPVLTGIALSVIILL